MERFIRPDTVMKSWNLNTTDLLNCVSEGELSVYDSGDPQVCLRLVEENGELYLKGLSPRYFPAHYTISHGLCVFKLSELKDFAKAHSLPSFCEPEPQHALEKARPPSAAEDPKQDTCAVPREDLSKKGQKGGKASKIKQAILQAVVQFLQEKPSRQQDSAAAILNAFKKKFSSSTKTADVISNGADCTVYHYANRVYCKTIHGNGNVETSISASTFKNKYVSRAKKEITNT